MTSHSTYLFKPLRSETQARQEMFIRDQIAGMRIAGFPESTIAREEALLRGGFEAAALMRGIFKVEP